MNYQKVDSDARLANLSGAVDPATGLGAAWTGFSNDFRSEKKSLDVNAGGPFSLFGRRHQLLVGADWTKVRDDQDTFYSEMDTPAWLTNVYDFDPGRIPPAVSERKTRSYPGYGATQKGLYGRVNLSLTDQLTAIVGGATQATPTIRRTSTTTRPAASARAVASTTAKAVFSRPMPDWCMTWARSGRPTAA